MRGRGKPRPRPRVDGYAWRTKYKVMEYDLGGGIDDQPDGRIAFIEVMRPMPEARLWNVTFDPDGWATVTWVTGSLVYPLDGSAGSGPP